VLLLVLDQFFEGADVLVTHNLDCEDVTAVITQHKTVDVEGVINGAWF
jgi:hypothetical protein